MVLQAAPWIRTLATGAFQSPCNGEKTVDNDTRQLIMDVMNGNPGAFTIIRELMAFPTWFQLLYYLKEEGLIGSELWRIVKDEYDHDYKRFVDDQLARMTPERAQTLRALGQRASPRHN